MRAKVKFEVELIVDLENFPTEYLENFEEILNEILKEHLTEEGVEIVNIKQKTKAKFLKEVGVSKDSSYI